jgi:Ca-activated chloride channel family protein
MRPQEVINETKQEQDAIDIFIALDISLSMQAEDLKPNRIEAAKSTIQKFLTKVEGNRIGTVIFAGIAFVQAPLSFDTKIIYDFIGKTSTNTINQQIYGLDGTAIGDAIFTAVEKLKDSKTKNKIIILLTDGEANRGADPIITAQYARDNNIKVYTIGIGDPNGAIIPVIDPMGNKTYLIGPDGQPLKTSINIKALEDIASITHGKFFMADDNAKFENVFDEIAALEKSKIKTLTTTKYKDLYPYPLGLAIILLLIDYLWFERRRV